MYVCLWDFLLTTSIQTFALWLHPLRPKLAEYKVMKPHVFLDMCIFRDMSIQIYLFPFILPKKWKLSNFYIFLIELQLFTK